MFLARFGPFEDLVVRLCGADGGVFTNNVEACLASTPAAGWSPLGNVPPVPRTHSNAVILPDGSVVVIGGNDGNPVLRWNVANADVPIPNSPLSPISYPLIPTLCDRLPTTEPV